MADARTCSTDRQCEQFLRLMAQGLSNSEACRRVGVNRMAGCRWTYGRAVIDRTGQAGRYEPIANDVVRSRARWRGGLTET
ncbi:hypothetical protein KRMM14A1259_68420 [Krasilnikovia sp. MM14-A1259]